MATPAMFLSSVRPWTSELLNRPGIGWSELGSTLEVLSQLLALGENDILHPKLTAFLKEIFRKHDLVNAAKAGCRVARDIENMTE